MLGRMGTERSTEKPLGSYHVLVFHWVAELCKLNSMLFLCFFIVCWEYGSLGAADGGVRVGRREPCVFCSQPTDTSLKLSTRTRRRMDKPLHEMTSLHNEEEIISAARA